MPMGLVSSRGCVYRSEAQIPTKFVVKLYGPVMYPWPSQGTISLADGDHEALNSLYRQSPDSLQSQQQHRTRGDDHNATYLTSPTPDIHPPPTFSTTSNNLSPKNLPLSGEESERSREGDWEGSGRVNGSLATASPGKGDIRSCARDITARRCSPAPDGYWWINFGGSSDGCWWIKLMDIGGSTLVDQVMDIGGSN
ncbi:hypothetical protein Btru_063166 [Bulinus truncatus]|nr:hypothetical protein Btru_063166 [Bulinus truncatus]